MTVSIVIPVFNSLPDLVIAIRSLAPTINWQETEVILVDDASPNFDARILFGPPLKVFRNEKNLGFGPTCNFGAEQAKGDFLIFMNSDIIVSQGWLQSILNLFENPKIGIIGPKLLFPFVKDESPKIQSCGGLFDGNKSPFHRYIGWNADDWRVNQTESVKWITGACLAIRREDFFKLNGFNPNYKRAYFEDVDLCMRMRFELQKEIWYCHESVMIHSVGKSTIVEPEKAKESAKSFRANATLFHELWDIKNVKDVDVPMVQF